MDTNAWAGLFSSSALFAADSLRFVTDSSLLGIQLYTSNLVLSELYSLLRHKFGFSRFEALDRVLQVRSLSNLVILQIDEEVDRDAWAIMRRWMRLIAWSYVDTTSFLLMWREGIIEALTADKHFTQAGFTRLLNVP